MPARISLVLLVLLATSEVFAQFSVHTINVDRKFYAWKDSGVNCNENVTNYWYVFREEMDSTIRQQVRYCGGSVLYIGKKNELHLYNQSIIVSCDSVTSLLKLDSNFINILPPITEEKISYEIYRDSGLYYVDSVNLIFGSDVLLNKPITDTTYNFIKNCIDSIDTTGNQVHVYGTREEVLCIASKIFVKGVFDLKKEGPLNSKPIPESTLIKKLRNVFKFQNKVFNLDGRVASANRLTNGVRVLDRKIMIKKSSH